MLTLESAKRHLRVFHDDEDVDIQEYLDAASRHVADYLDRNVYDAQVPADDRFGIVTNPALKQATKLVLGHMWEHREGVTPARAAELPMGVDRLLARYRVWRTSCGLTWQQPTNITENPVDADYAFLVSGGVGGYVYASDDLPAGLTLSADGKLTGAIAGSGTFRVTATDKENTTAYVTVNYDVVI